MEEARIEHAPNGSLLTYITKADALVKKHSIYLKYYRIRSFLNIRHAHGDLCKHVLQYSIDTNIYHFRSMKHRQYAYIPPNRRIHLPVWYWSIVISCGGRNQNIHHNIDVLYYCKCQLIILNHSGLLDDAIFDFTS